MSCACAHPAAAASHSSATLRATFSPNLPGHSASVGFDLDVGDPAGGVPSPLSEVSVRYPSGLGLALSGLGLETCPPERLRAAGVTGCPRDSIMGEGSALAEIQIGPQILREHERVTIVRAPDREGHVAISFYASGAQPVIVRAVFTGLLLAGNDGGSLAIRLPPIEGLPGSDIALVSLHLVLGPPNLVYYERVGAKTVAYHPEGIRLPSRCPSGGFRFAGALAFLDGDHAHALATVPCPRRR
jgi:hypothetical protein